MYPVSALPDQVTGWHAKLLRWVSELVKGFGGKSIDIEQVGLVLTLDLHLDIDFAAVRGDDSARLLGKGPEVRTEFPGGILVVPDAHLAKVLHH